MYDYNDHTNSLKEAADLYPLKTDFDDWDILHSKLIRNTHAVSENNVAKKNETGQLWQLLLTVIFCFPFLLCWKVIGDPKVLFNQGLSIPAEPATAAPPRRTPGNYLVPAENTAKKSIINDHAFGKNRIIFSADPGYEHSGSSIKRTDLATGSYAPPSPSVLLPVVTGQILVPDSNLSDKVENRAKNPKRRSGNYFYGGLSGSVDLSRVSSQSAKKLGFSAGALLGRTLTPSLSLETGVVFRLRNYYTAGEYFSMSQIGPNMPSGMEIINVNGKLYSFQFPLKLKYDFTRTKGYTFFVTSGITSTLLYKECNDYLTMLNNQMKTDRGVYEENNFFSASDISVSLGLERRVNDKIKFRFEPYYSVPLKRIGMGSINVQHAGVNFILLYSRDKRKFQE